MKFWRRRKIAPEGWTDANQIAAQAAAGVDLSHPLFLDHYIYVFDAERAESAVSRLSEAGYEVSSRYCPDHDPPEWEIVASGLELVTPERLAAVRELMESVTMPLDEYDGWTIRDDALGRTAGSRRE